MDWSDLMRGFFGNRASPPPPLPDDTGNEDEWPPPPPISDFRRTRDENPSDNNQHWGHGQGLFRDRRPSRNGTDENGFHNYERSFVFGDLFSTLGEVFQEMERSIRDMEGFFGNMGVDDHQSRMIPFSGQSQTPPFPPTSEDHSKSRSHPSNDENIRNFVLKEPDMTPSQGNRNDTHYIQAPSNASEKIDRDLDDLFQKSQLDLSTIPVPKTGSDSPSSAHPNSSPQNRSILPFNFGQRGAGGGGTSSFQRTYQTFSFRNGRWEGEVVKEDQNGKEVTKFYQDKDGQRHETTEYIPKTDNGSSVFRRPIMDSSEISPEHPLSAPSNQPTQLFQFFDRFFKPRM